MDIIYSTDVLVIGCGIAGCITALELAEQGIAVTLLGSAPRGVDSNSYAAQGGIIYCGKEDSAELLKEDILQAGCGLSYPTAVDLLTGKGPSLVKALLVEKYGVPFNCHEDGSLALTQEGAHSLPRVIFSYDQTGRIILETLFEKIMQHPLIHCRFHSMAIDLITLSHHSKIVTDIYHPSTCVGAYVLDLNTGGVEGIFAKETVLATGGIGEIYLHTTNPQEARGDGIAMAYRAGARIMNMEYVQFHPTALFYPKERRFLISEALRGEGAELLTAQFEPFMHRYHPKGSLAPRDVTARAIYQEMLHAEGQHIWLDVTGQNHDYLKKRFPHIFHHCLERGYDMTKVPVPIVPAAHYSCGGIAVDLLGRTTICRLRAVGEVACTGVHGANRLASNSLLEAVVFGRECAHDIVKELQGRDGEFPPVEEWVMSHEKADPALVQQDWMTIKQTMWNYVGLIRDKVRLQRAFKMLRELQWEIDSFYARCQLTKELVGLRNAVQIALLVTQGALRNRNSRGCHYRVN